MKMNKKRIAISGDRYLIYFTFPVTDGSNKKDKK